LHVDGARCRLRGGRRSLSRRESRDESERDEKDEIPESAHRVTSSIGLPRSSGDQITSVGRVHRASAFVIAFLQPWSRNPTPRFRVISALLASGAGRENSDFFGRPLSFFLFFSRLRAWSVPTTRRRRATRRRTGCPVPESPRNRSTPSTLTGGSCSRIRS